MHDAGVPAAVVSASPRIDYMGRLSLHEAPPATLQQSSQRGDIFDDCPRSKLSGWFHDNAMEQDFVAASFSGTTLYAGGVALCAAIVALFAGGLLATTYPDAPSRYAWLFYVNTSIAGALFVFSFGCIGVRAVGKAVSAADLEHQHLFLYFLWTLHAAALAAVVFVTLPQSEPAWIRAHGVQAWRCWDYMQFYFLYGVIVVRVRVFLLALMSIFGVVLQALFCAPFDRYPGLAFVCLIPALWLLWLQESGLRRRFLAHREAMRLLQEIVVAREEVHRLLGQFLPVGMLSRLVDGDVQRATRDACVVSIFFDTGLSKLKFGESSVDAHQKLQNFGRLLSNELIGFGGLAAASTHGPEHFLVVFGLPEVMHRREARAVGLAGRLIESAAFRDSLCIGIASGEVEGLIVPERLIAYQIFGPTVHIATALAQRAAASCTLITLPVNEALHQVRFSYETVSPVASNFGMIPALQVTAARWKPIRFDVDAFEDTHSSHHRTAFSRASRRVQAKISQRKGRLLRKTSTTPSELPMGEPVDLSAIREGLLTFQKSWFLSFPDREIERAYADETARAFTHNGRSLWLALVPWYAVLLAQVAIDRVSTPLPYILFSICAVVCVAVHFFPLFVFLAAKSPSLAAYLDSVSWWTVAAVAQIAFVTLSGKSEQGIGLTLYINSIIMWSFAALRGSMGMNWVVHDVVLHVCYIGIFVVTTLVTGLPLGATMVLVIAGVPIVFSLLIYRTEFTTRERFIDSRISAVAVGEACHERENVLELLRRSTPTALLHDVVAWLPRRSIQPFEAWYASMEVATIVIEPSVSAVPVDSLLIAEKLFHGVVESAPHPESLVHVSLMHNTFTVARPVPSTAVVSTTLSPIATPPSIAPLFSSLEALAAVTGSGSDVFTTARSGGPTPQGVRDIAAAICECLRANGFDTRCAFVTAPVHLTVMGLDLRGWLRMCLQDASSADVTSTLADRHAENTMREDQPVPTSNADSLTDHTLRGNPFAVA